MNQDAIPLVNAAARAGVSYLVMRDLVLCQKVRGWQDEQTRRWYVDSADLERHIRSRGDKRAVAASESA